MPALPLLKPREAAAMLGISYATVKQWILTGKLPTVQTPGGHHRITHAALKPFLKIDKLAPGESRERYRKVSGRNQLIGRVVDVQVDGLLAKVIVQLGDDQQITAIITSDAAREMGLKKGDQAAALVKATEVMIERV